jgi:sugar fermentation stimulation protein A
MKILDKSEFPSLRKAKFIERLNRFVGLIEIDGSITKCHIADTGRLKEILTKGREILVIKNKAENKTNYKLISAKMEEGYILINTSFHSKIAEKIIEKGYLGYKPQKIKKEVLYQDSRIDFVIDDNFYIEVKGCNLKKGKLCLFPDAPTSRGARHIKHLIELKNKGYEAGIMIIAFRDCKEFLPNYETDIEFSKYFLKALEVGVKFLGYKVRFDEEFNIVLNGSLNLSEEIWSLQKKFSS